ncbi:MAG TPA: DUF6308 family protein [Mycobacteriales bacterium]|jgi:hypothetical protein|nr:DUF6308 family protein [Mycobacteriales bacterium]
MQLCGGTLPIEDPEELLLAYVEPDGAYAYPAYDTLETNGSADLVDGDLLAPSLLGAHVDYARFVLLKRMLPTLRSGMGSLPATPLEDTDDAGIAAVARCFAVLDEPVYVRAGARGTIVSKVLHRKRPDLIPLYDSRIWTAYTVSGAIGRGSHRPWVEVMQALCHSMRADIRHNRAEFEALRATAAGQGARLTLLRILDILVWMSSEPPV